MGYHTDMMKHLHTLMSQRTYCNDTKTLARRDGWLSDLVPWSVFSNRVIMGLKPWAEVGESGAAQVLPTRIISHL